MKFSRVAPGPEVDPPAPMEAARNTSARGAAPNHICMRGWDGLRKELQVIPIGPDLIAAAIKNDMHPDLRKAAKKMYAIR